MGTRSRGSAVRPTRWAPARGPWLAIAALLLGTSGAVGQAHDDADFRLRPGDAIRLQIGGEPGLAGDYPVTDEGTALLPLIELVGVAGRPFSEVRAEVRSRYAVELIDAPVLITPVVRIAILGEVRQPGLLPVDPTHTLADVVAAAGGLTATGDPRRVTLVRQEGAQRVSLEADGSGGAERLRPGDRIIVGRQSWIRQNLNVVLTSGASILAAAVTALILSR